jgi:hypothetical protein
MKDVTDREKGTFLYSYLYKFGGRGSGNGNNAKAQRSKDAKKRWAVFAFLCVSAAWR